MRRRSLVPLAMLLAMALAACAPPGAPVSTPVPAATATPRAPRATATATPLPQPLAGALLGGPIEIREKASDAVISLAISDDGASATNVSLSLTELECDGFSAGSLVKQASGNFAIAQGKLVAAVPGIGEIDAQFTSPTEIRGTITILLEIPFGGTCDLGTWGWHAAAGEGPARSAPTPTIGSTVVAPQPTAPAPQVAGLELPVVNHSLVESVGYLWICGEVENRSALHGPLIWVTARVYDKDEALLAEDSTYAFARTCSPGELAPFCVILDRPAGYASYSLQAEAEPDLEQGVAGLSIGAHDSKMDPFLAVYGLVENGGTAASDYTMVIGVFYDEEGKVICVGSSSLGAPNDTLAPGETVPFLLWTLPPLDQPARYRLLVEGMAPEQSRPPHLEIARVTVKERSMSGEVTFPGPGTASLPYVMAVFYDEDGAMLDVIQAYLDREELNAAETGRFEILDLPEKYGRYELFDGYGQY